MITLEFRNYDAADRVLRVEVSPESVEPVLRWYEGYHAGDTYLVFRDGLLQDLSLVHRAGTLVLDGSLNQYLKYQLWRLLDYDDWFLFTRTPARSGWVCLSHTTWDAALEALTSLIKAGR